MDTPPTAAFCIDPRRRRRDQHADFARALSARFSPISGTLRATRSRGSRSPCRRTRPSSSPSLTAGPSVLIDSIRFGNCETPLPASGANARLSSGCDRPRHRRYPLQLPCRGGRLWPQRRAAAARCRLRPLVAARRARRKHCDMCCIRRTNISPRSSKARAAGIEISATARVARLCGSNACVRAASSVMASSAKFCFSRRGCRPERQCRSRSLGAAMSRSVFHGPATRCTGYMTRCLNPPDVPVLVVCDEIGLPNASGPCVR